MSIRITAARTNSPQLSSAAQETKKSSSSSFLKLVEKAAGKSEKSRSMDAIFSDAAEKYHVPLNLLKAVAKAESGFQADAVSSCGAEGIMQLMPSTASALGVSNAFDPEQNIMGGAKYLGQLLQSYGGNAKLSLAAYNAGSGNVKKYGGIPPFRETQNYVQKVLRYTGEDISAQGEPLAPSSVSSSQTVSAAEDSATEWSGTDGLSFSTADYQLFVRLFIQKLEDEALGRAQQGIGTLVED